MSAVAHGSAWTHMQAHNGCDPNNVSCHVHDPHNWVCMCALTHTKTSPGSNQLIMSTVTHHACTCLHTRPRAQRQNKEEEAGKQCSTMLSGRDLRLQKQKVSNRKTFIHSLALTQKHGRGESEREGDLYHMHKATHKSHSPTNYSVIQLLIFFTLSLWWATKLNILLNAFPFLSFPRFVMRIFKNI